MEGRSPNPAHRFKLFVAALTLILACPPSAVALDLGLRCRADPDAVFQAATLAAQSIPDWRAIRVIPQHRTIKAVVRNWRNFSVPVWIEVRGGVDAGTQANTELHLMWEQSMEPLNYPDVVLFMDAFREQQEALGLDCMGIGTDIGL